MEFSAEILQDFESIQILGGTVADPMAQPNCSNGAPGCGGGSDQGSCSNTVTDCGAEISQCLQAQVKICGTQVNQCFCTQVYKCY